MAQTPGGRGTGGPGGPGQRAIDPTRFLRAVRISDAKGVTERVGRTQPYATRLSGHRTTQQEEMVFGPQHGSDSPANMEPTGSGARRGRGPGGPFAPFDR